MFSLSTRFNVVLYNMMFGMVFMGGLNFLSGYYGEHEIRDVRFEMTHMDYFANDRWLGEHAAAFQYDLKADIRGLFNWNTNIIFLSVVCEYETSAGRRNQVTVWDQRIKREATEFH